MMNIFHDSPPSSYNMKGIVLVGHPRLGREMDGLFKTRPFFRNFIILVVLHKWSMISKI
jgi:hypothetical protein